MSLKNNTVAVVDYGMGNLRSVSQAVRTAAADTGWDVVVTADPEVVHAANRVVLPGQGAMPDCMRELRESGLQQAVLDAAVNKPLFGVCVGMQMLLDHSDEGDAGPGLIPAMCASSIWKAGRKPTAAASRCRRWAGTRCSRRSRAASPMRCGPEFPTAASTTLCTAFMRRCNKRALRGRDRLRRPLCMCRRTR
jgi:hypothetical protein